MKNIIVGLSGGVDSAMAALLLKEQGFNITGVMMSIWDESMPRPAQSNNACLGPEEEDIKTVKEIAQFLNIPFKLISCVEEYKEIVLDNFRDEYKKGRTPNPCIWCNSQIKFGILPKAAKRNGVAFDKFATGHYARAAFNKETGRWQIKKAADKEKDQTYFLYRLTQEQLAEIIFPLGEYTKQQVRALALKHKLPVAEKHDSQDFYCGDYNDILRFDEKPGNIEDKNGKVLGTHNGIWNYTIGKRKGLTGGGTGKPIYVIRIDAKNNKVIVGDKEDLYSASLTAEQVNWVSIEQPKEPIKASVKIRNQHAGANAVLTVLADGKVKVDFEEPQMSVTSGQSAVFYDGDTLLGGGIIL